MVRAGAAAGSSGSPGLGPDFHRLWAASTISNLGDGVRLAALPLLAASLTSAPGPVAGIRVAASLPWLLLALVAGVAVDRLDRRRLLWTVQAGRGALVAALGLAVAGGVDGAVLLGLAYLVAFGLGAGEVLADNAAQALLPSLVPSDRLQAANGRLYAAQELANRLAGPPLGGVLFVAAAAAPFLLDAASFAVGAGLLFLVGAGRPQPAAPPVDSREHAPSGSATLPHRGPEPGPAPLEAASRTGPEQAAPAAAPGGGVRRQVAEGLAWLWGNRRLRSLAVWTGVFNLTSGATSAIVVLYALEVLELGEAGFGVLLGLGALGGVAGGAFGPRLARRLGDGVSLVAITVAGGAANLVLGLTAGRRWPSWPWPPSASGPCGGR
jgi:MFS family permease